MKNLLPLLLCGLFLYGCGPSAEILEMQAEYKEIQSKNVSAVQANLPEAIQPYVVRIEALESEPNTAIVQVEKTWDGLLIKQQEKVTNVLFTKWANQVEKNRAGDSEIQLYLSLPDGSMAGPYTEKEKSP